MITLKGASRRWVILSPMSDYLRASPRDGGEPGVLSSPLHPLPQYRTPLVTWYLPTCNNLTDMCDKFHLKWCIASEVSVRGMGIQVTASVAAGQRQRSGDGGAEAAVVRCAFSGSLSRDRSCTIRIPCTSACFREMRMSFPTQAEPKGTTLLSRLFSFSLYPCTC